MFRFISRVALAAVLIVQAPLMAAEHYIVYSNPTYLPLSFEYPADWQAEPSSGTTESYSQVQFYPPRDPDAQFRAYLVVRMVPPKSDGGQYGALDDMIASYRSTMMPQLRIEAERPVSVLGSPATMLDIAGGLRLPWKSPTPTLVPAQGQRVFFERHGRLYELAWLSPVDQAQDTERIFARLIATLAPIQD